MTPLLRRIHASPTLMTWANSGSRVLSLAIVLPLVLHRFPPEDVALYYLLLSALTLQFLLATGFTPTLARSVSYALAGASREKLAARVTASGGSSGEANLPLTADLLRSMSRLFGLLGLLALLLGATAGTWLIWEPLWASTSPERGLVAWALIALLSPVLLWSQHFNAFLQGSQQIALEQRWAAIFALGAAVTSIAVVLLGGRVLALVAAQQFWQLAGVARNAWLVRLTTRRLALPPPPGEPGLGRLLWPQFWRASVGTFSSAGLIQLSGFFYARVAGSADLASYLLGLRVIQLIAQFSRAPFYSRIPDFNRLRATGATQRLLQAARQSMQRCYLVYVFCWAALLFGAQPLLQLLDSQTAFPSPLLWSLLGGAFLAERWGAMHLQLYSTTNHIVWHIANGFTALLMILLAYPAWRLLGVYGLPLTMALAYLAFYVWYSVKLSLHSVGASLLSFERSAAFPALAAFTLLSLIAVWL